MRKLALTMLAVALSGCAAQVISSSPRSVVVKASPLKPQEAQDLASAECAKHGRHAQLAGRPDPEGPPQWLFNCTT